MPEKQEGKLCLTLEGLLRSEELWNNLLLTLDPPESDSQTDTPFDQDWSDTDIELIEEKGWKGFFQEHVIDKYEDAGNGMSLNIAPFTADDLLKVAKQQLAGSLHRLNEDSSLKDRFVFYALDSINEVIESDNFPIGTWEIGQWLHEYIEFVAGPLKQLRREKPTSEKNISLTVISPAVWSSGKELRSGSVKELQLELNPGNFNATQLINNQGEAVLHFTGFFTESAMEPVIKSAKRHALSISKTVRSAITSSELDEILGVQYGSDYSASLHRDSIYILHSDVGRGLFQDCFDCVATKIDSKKNLLVGKIRVALELLTAADDSDSPAVSLGLCMSAIEAIVCNSNKEVTRKLKQRVPALLVKSGEEQEKREDTIGKLYKFRSQIFHGNTQEASCEISKTARKVAAGVVRAALEWRASRGSMDMPTAEAFLKDLIDTVSRKKDFPISIDLTELLPENLPRSDNLNPENE